MTTQEFKETPQGKALWEAIEKPFREKFRQKLPGSDIGSAMLTLVNPFFDAVAPLFIEMQGKVGMLRAGLEKMRDSQEYEGFLLVDPQALEGLLK